MSPPKNPSGANPGARTLQSLVDSLEALLKEKQETERLISEIYGQAKASGFDVKALKLLVQRRASDTVAKSETEALVDMYEGALARSAEVPA